MKDKSKVPATKGGAKALSWGNLRNEKCAYVQRYYVKVVFFVLVV